MKVPTGEIGLTPEETRKFSVARLLRAILDPVWGAHHAKFELKACEATRRALGKSETESPGYILPGELMGRALTSTGGVSSGGALVQTDVNIQYFAPALRAATKIRLLGATDVTADGNFSVPRLKPADSAGAVTENSASGNSEPTFELSTWSPKTIRNSINASRRLLAVAGTAAETIVRKDLVDAIAEQVDVLAIQGTGSGGQPTGLLSTSGRTVVALGTNGAAPTYANIVDCVRQVGTRKALKGSPGWLGNIKVASTMRTVNKATNWGFLWDDPDHDDEPQYDGYVLGYPACISESVPSNLAKGTGTNLSALIFGDWSELFIVEFSPIAIMANPFVNSQTGQVRFEVYQEVDIQPRRVDSFVSIEDMIAA